MLTDTVIADAAGGVYLLVSFTGAGDAVTSVAYRTVRLQLPASVCPSSQAHARSFEVHTHCLSMPCAVLSMLFLTISPLKSVAGKGCKEAGPAAIAPVNA